MRPPKTILIADDNVDIKTMLGLVLSPLGHRLVSAGDGRAALALAKQERPDVAILDLDMPGLDGFEVARAIREEDWGKKVLLIAATGRGEADDKRRSASAGFDAHLTKPFSLVELEDLLEGTA